MINDKVLAKLDKVIYYKSSPLVVIETVHGVGTGIFINNKGLVLTACHVFGDAVEKYKDTINSVNKDIGDGMIKRKHKNKEINKRIKRISDKLNISVTPLKFGFGESIKYRVDILEYEEDTDIALLKINSNKKNFSYIKINDNHIPMLGEKVYGITTTPPDEDNESHGASVFFSKIICIDKRLKNDSLLISCQTDFAPQSGNSGGAIVNSDGEIVGIITAAVNNEIITNAGSTGLGIEKERGVFSSLISSSIDFKKYL